MISISFGLACIGFILLSLSQKRHYLRVFPDSGNFQRACPVNRTAGYALVVLSAVPCVLLRGWWIGTVLWVSIWALAAFLQAMLLTYRPSMSLVFGGGGLALVILGLLA